MPRGSFATLDGRANEELLIILQAKSKSVGLLRASGSCASCRRPFRANSHSRTGARGKAPAPADCSRRQPSNRCGAPSMRPRPESGIRVLRVTVGIRVEGHGSLARRRVAGTGRDGRAHVGVPGYSWAGAIIRSRCLGSSSRPGSFRAVVPNVVGFRSRRSIASPSRRSAGSSSRRGSFGRRGLAKAHVGSGRHSVGSRGTAGCPMCHRFGLRQRGTATRRLAGGSKVLALSNVSADDRSLERPSNRRCTRRAAQRLGCSNAIVRGSRVSAGR